MGVTFCQWFKSGSHLYYARVPEVPTVPGSSWITLKITEEVNFCKRIWSPPFGSHFLCFRKKWESMVTFGSQWEYFRITPLYRVLSSIWNNFSIYWARITVAENQQPTHDRVFYHMIFHFPEDMVPDRNATISKSLKKVQKIKYSWPKKIIVVCF